MTSSCTVLSPCWECYIGKMAFLYWTSPKDSSLNAQCYYVFAQIFIHKIAVSSDQSEAYFLSLSPWGHQLIHVCQNQWQSSQGHWTSHRALSLAVRRWTHWEQRNSWVANLPKPLKLMCVGKYGLCDIIVTIESAWWFLVVWHTYGPGHLQPMTHHGFIRRMSYEEFGHKLWERLMVKWVYKSRLS